MLIKGRAWRIEGTEANSFNDLLRLLGCCARMVSQGSTLNLLRSSLVSRHTRLKERVVESAGIRSYRERSGPDRWHNRPGVDGVVADKAQTHCPRLERLALRF